MSALLVAAALAGAPTSGFQAACERLVGNRPAAVVAVDAASGKLLALVHPALAARPSPPGSVFKLVTAGAALEMGQGRTDATAPCHGWMRAPAAGGRPTVLRCWRPEGHGRLDLEGALAASCNLFFIRLGIHTGHPALAAAASRAGLEPAGVDPRDARIAIGEGAGWMLTPLQGAGLAAAIATGGPVRLPAWTPGPVGGLPFSGPANLARLRAGMRAAAMRGSARRAAVPDLEVAGKTGTATYRDGTNRTHGWFLGFARVPREARTLALAVRLEDASGFTDAASLAGQVFTAWRDRSRR